MNYFFLNLEDLLQDFGMTKLKNVGMHGRIKREKAHCSIIMKVD